MGEVKINEAKRRERRPKTARTRLRMTGPSERAPPLSPYVVAHYKAGDDIIEYADYLRDVAFDGWKRKDGVTPYAEHIKAINERGEEIIRGEAWPLYVVFYLGASLHDHVELSLRKKRERYINGTWLFERPERSRVERIYLEELLEEAGEVGKGGLYVAERVTNDEQNYGKYSDDVMSIDSGNKALSQLVVALKTTDRWHNNMTAENLKPWEIVANARDENHYIPKALDVLVEGSDPNIINIDAFRSVAQEVMDRAASLLAEYEPRLTEEQRLMAHAREGWQRVRGNRRTDIPDPIKREIMESRISIPGIYQFFGYNGANQPHPNRA